MIRKQQLIWIRPADNRVIIILWKSHNNCSSFIRLVLCNLINRLEKMTNHSVLALCSITIEHCQSDFGAKMLRMQSKNPQWPTKKKKWPLYVCVCYRFSTIPEPAQKLIASKLLTMTYAMESLKWIPQQYMHSYGTPATGMFRFWL